MPSQLHLALVGPLTPITVFQYAGTLQKLIIVVLMVSILAALAVLALKLTPRARLSGGSAFLSGLRLGAPIIGLLGACDSGLNMTLAVASIPIEPTLKMLAPGIAESFLMVGLGFLAGAIAVVGHWAVESRIDRQVLGA
ncbi:MAG TPA: MotA/TolQ/ExbB proton channel family protein [Caulobacteraceae bacterium]|nr:MotA/TolQ/ExbB proton channel family protein [Caulobacteraceae bacterium]